MRAQRGSSMILALLALALAASVSALVFERASGLDAATKHDLTELRAQYAAEGGLAEARWRLARDPAWKGGTVEIDSVRVTVTVETRRVIAVAAPGSVRLEESR